MLLLIEAGLGQLLLRWPLWLGWGWPWPRRPGHGQLLVLSLSVGYDCPQKQRNDGHEVKVPLGSQKLVQVKLSEQISNLYENNVKIVTTSVSDKGLCKLRHKLQTKTELKNV